jgi:hypothetical protein
MGRAVSYDGSATEVPEPGTARIAGLKFFFCKGRRRVRRVRRVTVIRNLPVRPVRQKGKKGKIRVAPVSADCITYLRLIRFFKKSRQLSRLFSGDP